MSIEIQSFGTDLKPILNKVEGAFSLKELANLIIEDIRENIEQSKNFDGSAMSPLRPSTISLKAKSGGLAPSKPLIFKGGLISGIKMESVNKDEVHIIEKGISKDYSKSKSIPSTKILQMQWDKGRKPFGVSQKALNRINARIKERTETITIA